MVKYAIGFSNYYYTLWSYMTEPQYITDNYGKSWLVGYNITYHYHKNISMNLEKALAAYPELELNEDLKGINSTTWTKKNEEDLCPNIMKFGRHFGKNIDDLVETNFDYVLWICEYRSGTPNGLYALSLPKVINHYKEVSDNEKIESAKIQNAYNQLLAKGTYEVTPERNLKIADGDAYMRAEIDGVNVLFNFPNGTFKEMDYNGFTYGLPLVGGKAKRIKSKPIRLSFERFTDGNYEFEVKVNQVEMI